MAEVLLQFTDAIVRNGTAYVAKACGAPTADGLWQGWLEFTPVDGDPILRSRRETTQPNRGDAVYWATGLSMVYLEGALERTLTPPRERTPSAPSTPEYDGPAPAGMDAPRHADAVLDPFSVYRKGELLLRRQLGALSAWHLVNVIVAYSLSRRTTSQLSVMTQPDLIELIVAAVRLRAGTDRPRRSPDPMYRAGGGSR